MRCSEVCSSVLLLLVSYQSAGTVREGEGGILAATKRDHCFSCCMRRGLAEGIGERYDMSIIEQAVSTSGIQPTNKDKDTSICPETNKHRGTRQPSPGIPWLYDCGTGSTLRYYLTMHGMDGARGNSTWR